MIERDQVLPKDRWNLTKLFANDQAWDSASEQFTKDIDTLAPYKGTLGSSVAQLKQALDTYMQLDIVAERLGYYAMLRLQENLADPASNARYALFSRQQAEYAQATSFIQPEIHSIDPQTMQQWLNGDELTDYSTYLHKIFRYQPHVLTAEAEALLAPLSEIFQTPDHTFSALTDADFTFGDIILPQGKQPLTQANYTTLLKNPDRTIRQQVYQQYYQVYQNHKNTLASLYSANIKQDMYMARTRHFSSVRISSLFSDNISETVYDNLIQTVRRNLPTLHRYYAHRQKVLKLDHLRHYDVYVPLYPTTASHISYEQGVDILCQALQPLGDDYVAIMRKGLLDGWVDRYENKGKSSGAFSAGSYLGDPYILMNYKPDNLRSLFTLAHEAGHSMHSYYSVQKQKYQDYNYTIFEAETASTLNEALLFDYLIKQADSPEQKRYLIGERLDDILSTLFRQTMFAEFEHVMYRSAEQGQPLTLEIFLETYQQLIKDYFGDQMQFEDYSALECLRIPHFYRSFYVYKYATGISASLALSQLILSGDESYKLRYRQFLQSGGSQYPLDNLKATGVDMSSPAVVQMAIDYFAQLLDTLEQIK